MVGFRVREAARQLVAFASAARASVRSAIARGLVVPRSSGRRRRGPGVGDRAGGAMPRGGSGGGRWTRLPHAAHATAASRGQECRGGRRADAADSAARAGRCECDLRGVDTLADLAPIDRGFERRRRLRLDGGPASPPRCRRLGGGDRRTARGSPCIAARRAGSIRVASNRVDRRTLPRSAGSPRREANFDRFAAIRRFREGSDPSTDSQVPASLRPRAWCPRRPCLQNSVRITHPNRREHRRGSDGFWR